MKTLYMLVVLFTDSGVEQAYNFASEAECEQVKPAVMQLYKGLNQPVTLTCLVRELSPKPLKERVIIKESYKVKVSYKL